MHYNKKQISEFRSQFIMRQRYQVAAFVPLAGAAFLVLVSVKYPELRAGTGTIALGALLLSAAGALVSWLVWRCPACSKYLGKALNPDRCPHCKVALGPGGSGRR